MTRHYCCMFTIIASVQLPCRCAFNVNIILHGQSNLFVYLVYWFLLSQPVFMKHQFCYFKCLHCVFNVVACDNISCVYTHDYISTTTLYHLSQHKDVSHLLRLSLGNCSLVENIDCKCTVYNTSTLYYMCNMQCFAQDEYHDASHTQSRDTTTQFPKPFSLWRVLIIAPWSTSESIMHSE